jgi:thimet oligopeptidase
MSMKGMMLGAVLCSAGMVSAAAASTRITLPIYDAAGLKKTCAAALTRAKKDMIAIQALRPHSATNGDTLNAWNRMQMRLEDALGPIDLYANVSPDEKVRTAADECLLKANTFGTDLLQNEKLYASMKARVTATAHQRQFRQNLLDRFEDTGVALASAKRGRVKAILDKLEALRQEFEKNVREDRTKVIFTSDEMRGMPKSYLDNAKRDDKGSYVLGFDTPEYEPFMERADSEEARQRYYIAFTNRGGERNLQVMNEIMQLRLEMARLYGLSSYAALALRHKMVEKPSTVIAFLEEVRGIVNSVERREFEELRALKAETLSEKTDEAAFNRWDVRYYQEKMRKARFDIDQEQLRRYFPMPAAVDYALLVSSRLYGIKFQRAEVPIWHPDVFYYDVTDAKTGKYLSGIYLDLYPRDGKYKHAAAWGVRGASRIAGRTPISVLVTNFNRDGLNHRELETLLHEFGHVLHGALSLADYNGDAGTATVQDFVEAPSQMFEEWARRPESLGLFRQVCSTCPVLDPLLIRRINDARKLGAGLYYARQLLYASYDMSLTGEHPGDALEVWNRMEAEGPLGHVEGTIFPANFQHLANNGYGAGYYGYMWSQVLALDMLSVFGDNIMNAQVGERFRATILANGGQVPAKDLVRQFLGREPNSEAFFAEITGRR